MWPMVWPGNVDDADLFGADGKAGGFGQRIVKRRQAVGVSGGAKDHGPGRGAQRFDARDVVIVVVGDQDVGQLPATGFQRCKDGCCVGDVDDGGLARGRVVDKVGIVVRPAGDGHKFKGHGLQSFPGYDARRIDRQMKDRNAP